MPQFLGMPSHIFVDLSTEEEIFVANNHNIIGHNIHKISHTDMVKVFRSVKPTRIDVTSKRCEDTKEWREKCQQHISPGKEISSYQSIFWIACSSEAVYKQCVLVFGLHEQGELKNQQIKKNESISTPSLNVTTPWRALMTLPKETILEMLVKVTNLDYDLEEMTKRCEKRYPRREAATIHGEQRKNPGQKSTPMIFQEDSLTFLKAGREESTVDITIFNEEIYDWQPLLRVCVDLPFLKEDHTFIISTSWSGVSDTKKAMELMYPDKGTAVVVYYNKKSNCIQPFVCLSSSKSKVKTLTTLVEGPTKTAFFGKLFSQVNKKGNTLVLHCGKGEVLQSGLKKGFNVVGVDGRNDMIRSCNRFLY
ncbi:uncharacterized protein LOC125667781 [Ostrea edulis]|uniref:uncharacterized protein LOC125667781 n=1 Tax=Ostrea edulis TaxID=37623 RepID=UPI0024AF8FE4|nr:uncharacterized protein LOC125667781 [Ostrea edulis]